MSKKLESSAPGVKPVYMEPHKDMPSTGVRIGVKNTVQCRKRAEFNPSKLEVVQYYECSPRTTGGLWLEESVWVRKLWWKVPWTEVLVQVVRKAGKVFVPIAILCIYIMCVDQYDMSVVGALGIAAIYGALSIFAVYGCTSKDIRVRAGMSQWVKCDLNKLENVMALAEIQRLENVDEASIIRDVDELLSISVDR